MFKKVVNRAHFSSFRANRKSMLRILKINVLVNMILQTMDKTVSFLPKTHFFVLGLHDFKRVLMTSSTCLHLHSKPIV